MGYNLPMVLWLGYALVRPLLGTEGVPCLVHEVLGWCPSCGTTTRLSDLLWHGRWPGWMVTLVLLGFGANAVWSCHRVWGRPRR